MDNDNSEPVVHKSGYLSRGGSYVLVLLLERSLLVVLKNCIPAESKNCYWSLTLQARFVSSKGGWRRLGSFCL